MEAIPCRLPALPSFWKPQGGRLRLRMEVLRLSTHAKKEGLMAERQIPPEAKQEHPWSCFG